MGLLRRISDTLRGVRPWAADVCGVDPEPSDARSVLVPMAAVDTSDGYGASVIRPANWAVLKNPARIFSVYVHPDCQFIRVHGVHQFSDCLGAALSNYGRVCSVGFALTSNERAADLRFYMRTRAQLGAAGRGWWDGTIMIALDACCTAGNPHSVPGLIWIIQHEIGHTRHFGHLGWPHQHAPGGSRCCMNPGQTFPARYPSTNAGVAQHGLAGFSRGEADYLAVRYGGKWLDFTEAGL